MARYGFCFPCGEQGKPVDAVVIIDGDPYCSPCSRMLGQQAPPAEPTPEKTVKPTLTCPRGCGAPTHRGKCKGAAKTGGKKAELRLKLPEPVSVGKAITVTYIDKDDKPIGMRMEQRPITVHQPIELLDHPATPTTLLEGSEHSRIEGDLTPDEGPGGTGPANAEAVAKYDGQTRQEAERQGDRVEATAGDVKYRRVSFDDIPVLLVARKPQGRVVTLWEQLCACTKEEPVLRVTCESIKRAGSIAHNLRTKAKTQGKKIDYRRDGAVLYVWLEEMEKTA